MPYRSSPAEFGLIFLLKQNGKQSIVRASKNKETPRLLFLFHFQFSNTVHKKTDLFFPHRGVTI